MGNQTRAEVGSEPDLGMESVACNLCGSADATLVLEANTDAADLTSAAIACTSPDVGRHGTIVRCDACGLVYANPRPTDALLDALYAGVTDETYLEEEEARVDTFRHALAGVRARMPAGRLLDVGAHVGTFLGLARAAGYEVTGVEPSTWAAEYARRERGLDVRPYGLSDAGLEPESFDVVTMWDVVEHFADPKAELGEVARVLRPGGLFALTTMDVGALVPRLLRGRWPWYMLMHQYYFTPETIARMLEETGFAVLGVEPHVRVTRVRYLISKIEAYSPPLHRLAAAAGRATGLGRLRIPVKLGDLMTVYARKA